MADIQWLDGGITAVPGILAAGVTAGIKPSGKKDLASAILVARAGGGGVHENRKGRAVLFSRDHVKGVRPGIVASPEAPTSAASRGSGTRVR